VINLPGINSLSLLSTFMLAALVGCANVSVSKTDTTYAARETNCAVTWHQGSYDRYSDQYEWVGEVTLHNEKGLSLSDDKRQVVEAQACGLGGDTVLRDTGVTASTKLDSFSNQKFGVLRRRAPGAGNDAPSFDDAPAPSSEDFAQAAGSTQDKAARLR
jgi:hypothetical protein